MTMLKTLIAIISLTIFGIAPAAAADPALGPEVGEALPHDLSAPDAYGAPQNAETLMGENGVALFFSRSLDWCPFCQAQAAEINEHIGEFEQRGLNVVFITYDAQEKQQKFIKKTDFKPAVLSDEDSAIIKAFGLLNENHEPGGRGYGIPHPAVFIVSPEQIIRAKLHEADWLSNKKSYRNRPTTDAVLEAADAALAAQDAS